MGKIICLGRNYLAHAKEMQADVSGPPVIFLKPPSALIQDGEDIVLPRISRRIHYEVELVAAIGENGKSIPAAEARRHVLGYGVGLDMTLRDLQDEAKAKGHPWTVSKGFDTSAPVSAFVGASEIPDPDNLQLRCMVNGVVRQAGRTSDMIYPIAKIIEYVSSVFSLEEGDLLFTGTPEGVGEVKGGDRIEAELVGYVRTTHRVRAA